MKQLQSLGLLLITSALTLVTSTRLSSNSSHADVTEVVTSFVTQLHHCIIVVTSRGRLSGDQVKALMSISSVQTVYTDQLERLLTQPQCGHLVWPRTDGHQEQEELLHRLGSERLRTGTWYWLGSLQLAHISGIHLSLHSQFYLLTPTNDSLEVVELYDVEVGGKRIWRQVGTWHSDSLAVSILTEDIWERRGDLWGTSLRTIMLPYCDFICLEEEGEPDSWYGLVPDIYNSLANTLNFTYSVEFSSDGKWGVQDKASTLLSWQSGDVVCPRRPLSGMG